MTDARALVAGLRSTLDQVMRQAGVHDSRVALLDWPHHTNSGDSAIWCGEIDTLRRLNCEVVYRSSFLDLSTSRMRDRLGPDGIVLLHGGGSFGDLYPAIQSFRYDVLQALGDRRVVQLPQSLHFGEPAALEVAHARLQGHGGFTLLARDHASVALGGELGCDVLLCPDAAFGIDDIRPRTPQVARVWLMRTDIERATQSPVEDPEGEVTDWPGTEDAGRQSRGAAVSRAVLQVLARRERLNMGPLLIGEALTRGFDPLARRRLHRGLDILGRGAVVITDRLHGHILSTLLGRRHVLLDNRIGKLSKFHATWTAEGSFVRIATSPAQALEIAQEWATQDEAADC